MQRNRRAVVTRYCSGSTIQCLIRIQKKQENPSRRTCISEYIAKQSCFVFRRSRNGSSLRSYFLQCHEEVRGHYS